MTQPDPIYSLAEKRVWVAGHKGMVGSALVRRLESEDCEVVVCHCFSVVTDKVQVMHH